MSIMERTSKLEIEAENLLGHAPYLLVEVFCSLCQSVDVKFGPKGLRKPGGFVRAQMAFQSQTKHGFLH